MLLHSWERGNRKSRLKLKAITYTYISIRKTFAIKNKYTKKKK